MKKKQKEGKAETNLEPLDLCVLGVPNCIYEWNVNDTTPQI